MMSGKLYSKKLEGEIFPCPLCDYKAKWKHHIPIHIESVHEGKTFQCGQCDYKATSKTNLRTHIKRHHDGEVFQCSLCEYKAGYKSSLVTHTKIVHEGKIFSCLDCPFKSKWQSHLRQHILAVHEGITFPCLHCEYKSNRKGNLLNHIKRVHEGLKLRCTHCEYITAGRGSLQSHIKSVHEGLTITQRFPCPHCKYKATQKRDLKNHIKAMHEGCRLGVNCDYETKWKSCLLKHVRTHEHEDPLTITQSNTDKDFKRNSESIHTFKSNVKMKHVTNLEGEYFEFFEAEEIVKGETEEKMENDNDDELIDRLEDMEGTKIKLELSMEQIDEKVERKVQDNDKRIKAKTEPESGDYYVCPISSCAFFVTENSESLRQEHLKSSHSNNDVNLMSFLKL